MQHDVAKGFKHSITSSVAVCIMLKKTEQELICELQGGSVKAFDAIYEMYARRLYAFCLKYTKSRERAEEIMEDTFIWLWNNRERIIHDKTLKPILFIKSKHLLINEYRKVVNAPVFEDYMDYLDHKSCSAGKTDGDIEYDDFLRMLNKAMDKLPKTQREIIRLSKLEMMNNKEIAECLNYSEQTVKNLLSLGLKQLRHTLGYSTSLVLLFLI